MSRRPHESRTLSRSRTQVHPHPHASEIAPRAAADLYSLLCDAMVAADTKAIDALLTDYCVLTHMTGYPQPKVEWLGDCTRQEASQPHRLRSLLPYQADL